MNSVLAVVVALVLAWSLPSQPAPRDVDLTAPDGTRLKTTYFAADRPGPAVLLLHMCITTRASWEPVARQLAAAGVNVMTIDNRGFGESGGPRYEGAGPEVDRQLEQKWPGDFDAAFAWLTAQPGVDKRRIGLGGGSCGVNNAVGLASRHADVRSLALLAGGTDSAGITYLIGHPWLPIFGAAAADDKYDPQFPQVMRWFVDVTGNPRNKFVGFADGGHGTEIFRPHPELVKQIVDWFVNTLVTAPVDPSAKFTPKKTAISEFWSVVSAPGGAAQATRMFREARARDPHAFLFPESMLNQLGYGRLTAGQLDDAVEMFKLNTEAYPASANAQDSLADAYAARGQTDLALAAEQKCLELLPAYKADEQFKSALRKAAEEKLAKLKASAGNGGQGSSPAPAAAHAIDIAGMDPATAPGDDFFRYANGTWLKTTEIPPERASIGVGYDVYVKTQEQTREIIDGIDRKTAAAGSEERQIADYYDTFLDEAAIEAQGLAPLQQLLAPVAAIQDRRALATVACGELRADVDALNNTNFQTDHLFGLWFAADLSDPTRYAAFLLQGGLGMPDRDYYLESGPEMEKARASYLTHIERMLTLAKIPDAHAKAARVFALEKQIAGVHATRTASVDVKQGNNPWTRDEFATRAPGLDWPACFAAAGLANVPRFIVWHPDAVRGMAALAGHESIDTWRDYLTFHTIDHYGNYLPKAFVDQRFAFYGTALSGTQAQRARSKRALDETSAALGDAVGKLYAHRFFPESAKQQLQLMAKNLIVAFDRRIDKLAWMDPKTKANAKAKLSTLIVGVGYPDHWRSYAGLQIVRGEALMNAWRAEKFWYDSERAKLGHPVARDEWMMTPQTVNAVNLPVLNALNFPAAILQAPYFDPAAPAAVNYGAVGAVIGHEISHSFDDQGSQFDASGRFTNWWTKEDFDHFKEASAKLVAQYNAYHPLPDLAVNGQLTLSENIADLAGLAAAYDAYHLEQHTPQPQDDRQLFIAYAQAWRTKMRDPLLRQLVMTDGHAPDEFRADTVRNLDPWYPAFDVKPGQRLYLAPADRVRVW